MSDEKQYTERDLVLAKREGYVLHCTQLCGNDEMAAARAVGLFPLPKRTQPRVVKDGYGIEWRMNDGTLEWKGDSSRGRWEPSSAYGALAIGSKRVALWANLLANPTEEVDA